MLANYCLCLVFLVIVGHEVMDEDMRIRIYIDGETTASLDFQLLLAHGIGFSESMESQYIPWGTRRISHEADGGIYNTYQIPFSKSFRVTATHPKGGEFWYIIRGVENYPLILGNVILPKTSRLRLYKNVNVELTPLEFIAIAYVTNSSGALYQVTLAANSTDYNYLEACFRARIDGANNITWLSSGTEDFFLSSSYFNKGVYHNDHSGLTYKGNKAVMSAYKLFEDDPIFFTKSLELIWRCGETIAGPYGCPNDYPPPPPREWSYEEPVAPKLSNTKVTTYVWVYEWQ